MLVKGRMAGRSYTLWQPHWSENPSTMQLLFTNTILFAGLTAVSLAAPTLLERQITASSPCGGLGWTGSTTCADGFTCIFIDEFLSEVLFLFHSKERY